jgi:hypothetical protein
MKDPPGLGQPTPNRSPVGAGPASSGARPVGFIPSRPGRSSWASARTSGAEVTPALLDRSAFGGQRSARLWSPPISSRRRSRATRRWKAKNAGRRGARGRVSARSHAVALGARLVRAVGCSAAQGIGVPLPGALADPLRPPL